MNTFYDHVYPQRRKPLVSLFFIPFFLVTVPYKFILNSSAVDKVLCDHCRRTRTMDPGWSVNRPHSVRVIVRRHGSPRWSLRHWLGRSRHGCRWTYHVHGRRSLWYYVVQRWRRCGGTHERPNSVLEKQTLCSSGKMKQKKICTWKNQKSKRVSTFFKFF